VLALGGYGGISVSNTKGRQKQIARKYTHGRLANICLSDKTFKNKTMQAKQLTKNNGRARRSSSKQGERELSKKLKQNKKTSSSCPFFTHVSSF
jgi:hypothetical protein